MTTDADDLSNYLSQPIFLYEFFRRSTPTISGVEVTSYWRYTSADRDFTFDGNVYTAIAISDDGVRQSGDTTNDQLTITVPYDNLVAQFYTGSPPSDPIYAMIRHANVGETDAFIAWAGLVGSVVRASSNNSATGDVSSQIVCTTNGASLDRSGLRLSWSRQCPHDLYGFECKADPKSFYVSATVTSVTGINVSAVEIGEVAAPQLAGGFLEWIDSYGHAERRGITQHAGQTVALLGTASDKLNIGDTVYAFFGCDHSRSTCQLIFGNEDNHGGHAYMPDANPFSGTTIF